MTCCCLTSSCSVNIFNPKSQTSILSKTYYIKVCWMWPALKNTWPITLPSVGTRSTAQTTSPSEYNRYIYFVCVCEHTWITDILKKIRQDYLLCWLIFTAPEATSTTLAAKWSTSIYTWRITTQDYAVKSETLYSSSYCYVLVLAGIKLIAFPVTGLVMFSGLRMRTTLITQQSRSCCRTVLAQSKEFQFLVLSCQWGG